MPQVMLTGVTSGLGPPKKETCQLAKALYDNAAESQEELNFAKGDILTVLEQEPCNIKGWWLCSFKGCRGLCPGNRLRLMNCKDSKTMGIDAIHPKETNQKIWWPSESNYVYAVQSIPHKHSSPQHSSPTERSPSTLSIVLRDSPQCHRDNDSDYEDIDNKPACKTNQEVEESCYDVPPSPVKVYNKCPIRLRDSQSDSVQGIESLNKTCRSIDLESDQLGRITSVTSVLTNDSSDSGYSDSTYDVPRHLSAVDEIDGVGLDDRRKDIVVTEKHKVFQEEIVEKIQTRAAYNHYLQSQSPHLRSHSPQFRSPQYSPIPTAYISQIEHHQSIYGNCPSPAASTTSISTDSASIMDIASSSTSSTSSNRSSLAAAMADYDVPRPFAGTARPVLPPRPLIVGKPAPPPRPVGNKPINGGRNTPTRGGNNKIERTPRKESFDVPNSLSMGQIKELPLELTPALESLQLLETEAVASINKLLEVAKSPNDIMRTSHSNNIHVAIVRFRSALSALAEFAEGVLGNAMKASDKNLAGKLRPLVEVLQNSASRIQTLTEQRLGMEELDGIVLCAVGLLDEVKQVASFVQGNSTLLFKRNSVEWDIKEDMREENGVTRKLTGAASSSDLPLLTSSAPSQPVPVPASVTTCLTPSTLTPGSPTSATPTGVITLCNVPLTNDDKAVLTFYARQAIHVAEQVNLSIDRFLHTVGQSEPPKVFLEKAKHLVVNAHALVHIGDAIVRGVANADVKNATQKAADALSEGLATHVQETRKAAEHFPSVQAVQEMVNSVAEVGHLSRTIKCILLQAAQP